ncbi:MAG: alanyl-tRNA editing protein [Acidobacteria bacterium]|nr:alanyl-tRNA editing protein [Acidobacteriota bacterium]
MTVRLYYADPYLREFDAIVTRAQPHEGGTLVVLDRTAFYPSSGGQPHDIGSIGEVAVRDVLDLDDGSIGHVVDGNLEPGQSVRGRIDWARRFDHMQQHTGQHVLSAAFDRLFRARTESFHLGATSSTIDLARALAPGQIASAEAEANRIVWEDRPVTLRFASADEAAELGLRKESMRTGTLRIVDVEAFDRSACGGTHVSRTGAIGIIAVASWERFRGGVRVEFLCGGRALRAYRALRDAVSRSVQLLSVLPAELPAGIERLQNEAKDQKRVVKALQERLAAHEAEIMAARAKRIGEAFLVVEVAEGYDANGLKGLASTIAARPGRVAVLCSGAGPILAVVARSSDVTLDASVILRALIAEFGGRGGGRPELAQGGGLNGSPQALLDFARAQAEAALRP